MTSHLLSRSSRGRSALMLLIAILVVACRQQPAAATPVAERATELPADTVQATAGFTTASPMNTPFPTNTPPPTVTASPVPLRLAVTATPSSPLPGEGAEASMILVPGATFTMGAELEILMANCEELSPVCRQSWFSAASPTHTVSLESFYIDFFEVTNNAYLAFLADIGSHEGSCLEQDCLSLESSRIERGEEGAYTAPETMGDYPVSGVTWYGASAFCEWREARLPTEAEWEMAASWDPESGTKNLFPWGNTFNAEAVNFCDVNCREPQAHPQLNDGHIFETLVYRYENGRSPVGAFNMGGNLWEWVADWFAADYYEQAPENDPAGPEEGESRVVRGGSWFDTGNFTATVIRFPTAPGSPNNTIGFRCAKDGPVD